MSSENKDIEHTYVIIKVSLETKNANLSLGDRVIIKDYNPDHYFYQITSEDNYIPSKCLIHSKLYELDKILKDL